MIWYRWRVRKKEWSGWQQINQYTAEWIHKSRVRWPWMEFEAEVKIG